MKVTFEQTNVVFIYVRGEKREFPTMPADGGLIVKLLDFMTAKKIYPARSLGHTTGGGRLIGMFWAEDAKVIANWLLENDVSEVEEVR